MKKNFTALMTMMALIWATTWMTACDDDDKPENPQDQIKKTWQLGSSGFVKQDGLDVTADYSGMTITLAADGTYTTSNAKKLFYPAGTWSWQGTGTSTFIVDSDFNVSVTELTKTTLRIQFHMDESHVNPDGRVNAVVGDYDVMLIAQ